jgi:hypothetical protein
MTTVVGIPVNGVDLLKEVGAAVFADPDMVAAVERDGQWERRALVQVELRNGSIVIRGDPALVERARDAARAVIEKRQGRGT